MKRVIVALSTGLLACGNALAAQGEWTLTVTEPAGIERRAEPASGGIPFKKGQVKSVAELGLFTRDGKAVPAQFSKLAPYEDGSVQWALADVLVDVPAGGRAEFLVKAGRPLVPAAPLKVEERDGRVTVETGAATFTVNTAAFSLIESVEVGGRKVGGPGVIEVTTVEGKVLTAGRPEKVSWEYKGPVRATLRVDGMWTDGEKEFLRYTTRLTFWAGLSSVRVDHSLRNSNPKEGDDVKMKSATVSLNLGFAGQAHGAGADWAACGDGQIGVLVAERHTGGCFPGAPKDQYGRPTPAFHKVACGGGKATVWAVPEGAGGKGIRGYGADFFALADCAHKDTEIWLDVYTGSRDAAANGARRKALASELHALPEAAWVSETACMGYGRFGTLADEIATYKKWGWKGWDDPKKQAPTKKAHDPDAYVAGEDIHYETEADSPELCLLMYLRTGERGWFDWGAAWARYYKSHACVRTDGFVHDGFRLPRGTLSRDSKRPCNGLKFGWFGPKEYGWSATRMCMCHTWGNGLFDYYCLTGDVDALEASLDIAEIAAVNWRDIKPGARLGFDRGWGRQYLQVIRAWQVTREDAWKKSADLFAQWTLKAPNRHECGLFMANLRYDAGLGADLIAGKETSILTPAFWTAARAKGLKFSRATGENAVLITDAAGQTWKPWTVCETFGFAPCVEAMFRYAETFDDAEMKKMVAGLAPGVRAMCWSRKCDFPTKGTVVGILQKDTPFDPAAWDDAHANCPGPGAKHTGYAARFLADVFAQAYAAGGDAQWLDWAKHAWNRGSKRGYWTTSQSYPDDEVAVFAGHSAPKGDGVDIRSCLRMFYEVPRARD